MNSHFERASLLASRGRHEEAIQELQKAIAEDGDDPYLHGLLAICLNALDQHQQALEAAKRSVELAPDSDYGHYVLSRVYTERSRLNEALVAINEAIRICPDDAMNYAWLSRIEYERENWKEAVAAADTGLGLDGENDVCLHYRSLSLTKLGRGDEARRDQEALLANDPNDPHTHAARGWTLLEEGNPKKAEEHFLEALRLDPTIDYARAGLANALKARHFLFGVALRFLLYLDRFRTWAIWILFIGVFFGLRQLDRFAMAHPDAMTTIVLLKAAIWFLLILIMVAHPLFDLVLRLDREGRRALSPEQIKASNWHAVCLAAALGMALLWSWKGGIQMRLLAISTLMLTFAITNTFQSSPGWVRFRMAWITAFAGILIPLSFCMAVAAVVLLVRYKLDASWMLKLGLFYLPFGSILISGFSDNIAEALEKQRPDSTTRSFN